MSERAGDSSQTDGHTAGAPPEDIGSGSLTQRTLPFSEDEYVAQALSHLSLLNRRRAERYARWRYQNFLRGEVASL